MLGRLDLGEAEYALRSAVRSAADALGAIRAAGTDVADPRGLVEQVLESTRGHRIPDHAPRAKREEAPGAGASSSFERGRLLRISKRERGRPVRRSGLRTTPLADG